MQRPYRLIVLVTALFLSACKKDTDVIPGNSAPADYTINDAQYRQYINRCYILVHGAEPDSAGLQWSLTTLKNGSFNKASRQVFLDSLFNSPLYKWQVFNTARQDYLNNTDTSDITGQIALFNILLTNTAYQSIWPILQYEIGRLALLQNAGYAWAADTISIRELHRRFAYNWFYDQINMGSANFVIFTFQQFLIRNPQAQELSSGISMVDGNYAIVLLSSGYSKEDYLNILFGSRDYEEACAVNFYRRFLQREPTSQEMNAASTKFHATNDYEQIQKDILITDEFAGL